MNNHTFIVMVRFKDLTKTKFHVSGVPACLDTARATVLKELEGHCTGVQAVVIRVDPIAP